MSPLLCRKSTASTICMKCPDTGCALLRQAALSHPVLQVLLPSELHLDVQVHLEAEGEVHKLGVAGASSEHGDGLKHHLVEEQSHRFVPQILSTRILLLLLLSGKAFGWLEPLAADGVLCWNNLFC